MSKTLLKLSVYTLCLSSLWCRASVICAQDISTGLTGYWNLDETSGTTASDSSGSGNNGTLYGGVVFGTNSISPAQVDDGLDFDGSDDYISIPNHSSLQFTSAITVAAWVRADSWGTSYDVDVILRKGEGNPNNWQFAIAEGRVALFLDDSDSNGIRGNTTLNTGQWYHVAATWDGSEVRIYVDAVLDNTPASYTSTIGTDTRPVYLGGRSGTDLLDGALDDVRVYDRALTAADIQALYDLASSSTGIAAYLSTTGGATFGGLTVEDEDIAYYDPNLATTAMYAEGDSIFTSDEDTDAFHIQSNGKILLSPVNNATIGSLSFEDEDVVEYDPNTGTATMYFEGDTVFSGDEDVDAFCVLSNGNLVLSTTGNATIGSLSFSDEDLVEYNPGTGTATLLLDGSTVITDDSGNGHDINAVHVDADGYIYLSMNNNSTIDGLSFGDDDVVRYDPNSGSATIVFDGSLFSASNEDIDALALPVPISETLEANWKLTELTGSTAADSSVAALDGTYTGGVTLNSNGPYPGTGTVAAEFDGTTDYVDLPDMNYEFTNGFSAAFWFKPDAAPTVEYGFLCISNGQDVDDIWIGWLPGTGIELYFSDTIDGEQYRWLDDMVDPVVGKWQHFAVSVDPNGNATIYRDGEAIVSGFVSLPAQVNRTENFIGDSVWNDNFDGSMFDVRVWNREISATEVADLYGLVGHWKMDEGSGLTAADSTGYANDASLSGATWTSTCSGKYALEFDGAGGTAATGAAFDPPAQGTVALWFRSNGTPAGRQRPWGLGGDFEMWQDTDGLLSCDVSTDGYQGGFITTTPLDTAGNWYHLVAVYDSADESYSIYIDGELHKTGVSTRDIVDQSAGILTFGTRTGNTQYFEGAIRDFRIYNRPLSNDEISDLSGLIAHWRFNELSGSVADDAGVAANDATFVSSPTLGVNGPYPTSTGTAVELNGSSQYITSGQSLLNDLSEFTIMGWLRPDNTNPDRSFFGQNNLIELGIDFSSNQIDLWTNAGGSLNATVQLPFGKWSHITATGSGSELKLYVNGREVATGGSSTSNYGSNSDIFKIGEGVLDASGDLFQGRIDDVRVYSRLLCPNEVNAAYKGGRPSGVRILEWVETR